MEGPPTTRWWPALPPTGIPQRGGAGGGGVGGGGDPGDWFPCPRRGGGGGPVCGADGPTCEGVRNAAARPPPPGPPLAFGGEGCDVAGGSATDGPVVQVPRCLIGPLPLRAVV